MEKTWYMGGSMEYRRKYGIWEEMWYMGGSIEYGRKCGIGEENMVYRRKHDKINVM